MRFGVTSDRNSVEADFRGNKESTGWERNHSRNGITPGLGSSLPSLFDSVLAAFSCSFCPLFLVGRWQPAALSNTKKKAILFANRANRSPQIEPQWMRWGQCPSLLLSPSPSPQGYSWLTWTESRGGLFPKENTGSVSRKKRAWV